MKNTKQKSKNKDNDSNESNVQSKADSNEYGDSDTVIGKVPPKNKSILCILW